MGGEIEERTIMNEGARTSPDNEFLPEVTTKKARVR
jgi:hypothetical protein